MFVAMNRFRVVPEREQDWERIWKERESYLQDVPGFVQFALLRGDEEGDYISFSVWRDRAAFDAWIAALRARGVEPDEAGLWDDYRVGALSGYFMAVFASMNVERTERGDEMFAVMAERPARQAIALGSLDLL